MARNTELLLTSTVENLGIVGDVVKVRAGYGRNYLLPMGLAEHPTPEKIESLKEARAAAQAEVARVRADREALVGRMAEVVIKLVRSCNDQGALYGAVTQRDIADQLAADGYPVELRAVRLTQTIRRVGHYTTAIQFDRDLRVEVGIDVLPDRALDIEMQSSRGRAHAEEAEETPEGSEAATATTDEGDAKPKGEQSGKPKRSKATKADGAAGDAEPSSKPAPRTKKS